MRPTADNRLNARAPRGASLTSNEESPTTPGNTTTNRGVPGLVRNAGQIPLFSSLVRARAASFPPDPQVANASPYTWVVANAVRPSSPIQDINHRDQAVQVSVGAAPSSPTLRLLHGEAVHWMYPGSIFAGAKHNCPNCNAALSKDNASVLAAFRAHAESGNAAAIYHLGQKYYYGDLGLQVDVPRAIELWVKAAELGDADAHYDLGVVYFHGDEGVDKDEEKGIHHWQQAAMKGQAEGRHALGLLEFEKSNYELAFKHWTISASMGYEKSSQAIECAFELGDGTGEQRARALRGFQDAVGEMKIHPPSSQAPPACPTPHLAVRGGASAPRGRGTARIRAGRAPRPPHPPPSAPREARAAVALERRDESSPASVPHDETVPPLSAVHGPAPSLGRACRVGPTARRSNLPGSRREEPPTESAARTTRPCPSPSGPPVSSVLGAFPIVSQARYEGLSVLPDTHAKEEPDPRRHDPKASRCRSNGNMESDSTSLREVRYGLEKDVMRAVELYERAAELGVKEAHHNLGVRYANGEEVAKDRDKAFRHYEAAAMSGCVPARYNLGIIEGIAGNHDLALQHLLISAKVWGAMIR
ncbi:hypothetical protein THAOC_36363 [Thalassiosira oceanica]|uniref:Uncharacterized protein n=1 Tax=Thalassiosira oceanica TaxID=159749 RepID=K0REP6_THAOC|nr:hypothetical protein THAOC_36363 [Thalassiosira oceanica]|eukprot:EJK45047.1 hypothetical protein THAOC_36363 [Thalassiosira oceanica]